MMILKLLGRIHRAHDVADVRPLVDENLSGASIEISHRLPNLVSVFHKEHEHRPQKCDITALRDILHNIAVMHGVTTSTRFFKQFFGNVAANHVEGQVHQSSVPAANVENNRGFVSSNVPDKLVSRGIFMKQRQALLAFFRFTYIHFILDPIVPVPAMVKREATERIRSSWRKIVEHRKNVRSYLFIHGFIVAFLVIIAMPAPAHAYFATQSLKLASSSSQYMSRAKTGSSNMWVSGAQDFTFETWMCEPNGMVSGGNQDIYTQSWKTGANLSFAIQLDNTAGTYGIRFRGGSSGNQDFNQVIATWGSFAGGSCTTSSNWHHIALVYTAAAGKAEVFRDGVSIGSKTGLSTSIFNGTDNVNVGAEGDGGSGGDLQADLSLTRLWLTARTASQITASYCSTLGTTASLGAEWPFSVSTTADNSGNSNTLTAVNTPTLVSEVPAPACGTAAATFNPYYFWDY